MSFGKIEGHEFWEEAFENLFLGGIIIGWQYFHVHYDTKSLKR